MRIGLNNLLSVQEVAHGWKKSPNAIYIASCREVLKPVVNSGSGALFRLADVEWAFGPCPRPEFRAKFVSPGKIVDTNDLFSVQDVMRYHRKSRWAIYLAMGKGKLTPILDKGKSKLFLRKDVEAMVWPGRIGRPRKDAALPSVAYAVAGCGREVAMGG